jgi:branched-chain amino acid transport system substrate-binding protein
MKRPLAWIVALALAAASGAAFAADPVKIGLMAPLTGAWSSEGQGMQKVVLLLAEQQNAKGGVLGRKIEIVTEDDRGEPSSAALAAQRLVAAGVVVAIGTYGSAITEASQPIFDRAKIPQIANGSTAVNLSARGYRAFFRTAPRDDEQGRVAARTMQQQGYRRIAFLHDGTAYATGLAKEASEALDKRFVEVVYFDALSPGGSDYSDVLAKLKSANPDVVFFTGYFPEAAALLRQKKSMSWNVPFIGGDATNNPDLVKIAGRDAAAGFLFVSPRVPQDLDAPEAKAFLAAYRARYNEAPASIWSVLAGDAFQIAVAAIAGTASTDGPRIAEYLHGDLRKFSAFSGTIGFDAYGDRKSEVYRIYKIDAEGRSVLEK